MKVIWRQKGQDWEIASGRRYKDEKHLQEFLTQNPSLIPFEDVSKEILSPRVMIREVGLPGSGSSDIVGVDERGGITIIECKLATNPEVKRKVIGQVLEYAAFLWHKPYSALDGFAIRRLGKPLVEAIREALNEEECQDWTENTFVEAATRTLDAGEFQLVIAVDAVNNELQRTIEYLAREQSRLAIYALEIAYFSSEQGEVLVPHLHGPAPESMRPNPSTDSQRWTQERFFEDAQTNKHLPEQTISLLKALLGFCQDEATRVYWGAGKQTGSFTFHFQNRNKTFSLFSVYSDSNLAINFGWLKDNTPHEVIADYWRRLQEIKGLRSLHVKDDFKCWPSMKVAEAFRSGDDLEKFKEIVLNFRDQITEL